MSFILFSTASISSLVRPKNAESQILNACLLLRNPPVQHVLLVFPLMLYAINGSGMISGCIHSQPYLFLPNILIVSNKASTTAPMKNFIFLTFTIILY